MMNDDRFLTNNVRIDLCSLDGEVRLLRLIPVFVYDHAKRATELIEEDENYLFAVGSVIVVDIEYYLVSSSE